MLTKIFRFFTLLENLSQKHYILFNLIQENLTYGLENGSILDLKIGYKTYHPCCTQDKKEKEIKKANLCDQILMGFRAAGIKIRDQNGVLTVNKNGSEAYNWITSDQQMKDVIEQVFKSNQVEQPNREALKGCINFIQELIEALQTSKRLFRSTSILIIVDNISKKYQIKWIDFNYVMKLSEDSENPDADVDNNIIGGLKYLLSILKSIEQK